MMDDVLVVIPARGGSKGVPGKNIRSLHGIPLIGYSIAYAKALFPLENIVVSTDDPAIQSVAQSMGISVPSLRPSALASDTASTNDVLVHVYHASKHRKNYRAILLLQPTSPFRALHHAQEAIAAFDDVCDMVVSVHESSTNPYYTLMEEEDGFLQPSKKGNFTRRQDCPTVYELNGSIYVIRPDSLISKGLSGFTQRKKYVMDAAYGVDIDTLQDWNYAEYLLDEAQLPSEVFLPK